MSDYQGRDIDTGAGTSGMSGNTNAENSGMGGSEQGDNMQRVQEMANQARERVSQTMNQVGDSMSRMSQEVSERLRTGVGQIRGGLDSQDLNVMYDDVLEQARMHPGRTILISAAVGMVLGMIMRGGRQNY